MIMKAPVAHLSDIRTKAAYRLTSPPRRSRGATAWVPRRFAGERPPAWIGHQHRHAPDMRMKATYRTGSPGGDTRRSARAARAAETSVLDPRRSFIICATYTLRV